MGDRDPLYPDVPPQIRVSWNAGSGPPQSRPAKDRPWSSEERDYLVAYWEQMSLEEIADVLDRPKAAVAAKYAELIEEEG